MLITGTARAGAAATERAVSSYPHWVGTWAANPQRPEQAGFDDVSLRLIVHTTIGGNGARIRLTNFFGTTPLQIGAATVGVAGTGASVRPGTLHPITFAGQPSVTIAPGGQVASDAVPGRVPAATNLAVSLYLPAETGPPTEHADFGAAHQVSYISTAGNHVGDPTAAEFPNTTTSWFFLDGVDVVDQEASAVVALGDSITDGTHSTDNTNHRYPDWLADRLRLAGGPYAKLSVLNAGIGGNELLRTSACCGSSPSALARLDSDVLSQPGVRDVIVLLGTNDILGAHQATASAVIAGLRELIARVHARGLRVFGGTITPSSQFTPAEEQIRETVNNWISTSGAFDGVIDFSAAVADPSDPARLNPVYDSGDHLHPNDTGYHAMADAVNLSALLAGAPGASGRPPGRPCLVLPSLQPIKPGAGLAVTCHPQPAGYTYDDTSPELTYSGAWTHAGSSLSYTYGDYNITESFSAQAGASVTVNFTGTGVELAGPLNTNAGIADVYVDGNLAARVDTYAPWGKQFQQDVFSAQHLRPGHHTMTVVVTGQKNPASSGTEVVVDAIQVTPIS
jgi:lysophospholipase L1-like esterase